MKFLQQLRTDERGIYAVEFAFVAPILLLAITGIMEYSYVAYARSSLESATIAAARVALAHDCPATREADVRAVITDAMSNVRTPEGRSMTIEYKAYGDEFGSVGTPEPFVDLEPKNKVWDKGESYTDTNDDKEYSTDQGKSGNLGDAGQVVSYTATYDVISLFPSVARRFNNGLPYYSLRASTVVRNEPKFDNRCPAA